MNFYRPGNQQGVVKYNDKFLYKEFWFDTNIFDGEQYHLPCQIISEENRMQEIWNKIQKLTEKRNKNKEILLKVD